jgi:asparagine synthase (glutamine-hydrolysing)
MCGFTITKEKIPNLILHRGINTNDVSFNGWEINFNSLPLSSFKLGLSQPIDVCNYLIVFNGEIFNHKELNRASKSDLHFLQLLMEKCKGDINLFYKDSLKWEGFWSICIVKKNGDVFAFTDPLGKKQLYFNNLGIASEIKPLLSNNMYLSYNEKSFGRNGTNFNGIYRFMPGDLYRYKLENSLPSTFNKLSYWYKSPISDAYRIIDENVRLRLSNNYDGISILLSGGLDSNIVLHHVLKYTSNIDVVSIENDESENVRRICNEHNLECNFISDEYTQEDVINAVSAYEHSLDYGSLLPNYLLFKNCKNSLVLTGDGADELFGGYQRSLHSDTFNYDVFNELPFYHNIRIDRMSMISTKEARSPLMSFGLLRYAKNLKREDRTNKKILRETYNGILPDYIVNGKKKPLRLKNDKEFNMELINNTHQLIFNKK